MLSLCGLRMRVLGLLSEADEIEGGMHFSPLGIKCLGEDGAVGAE